MIDTQAIRSKILDLAMRGQLTEQYENEVLDYDAFHLTGNEPFSIPCNWKWAKIETIIAKDVGGGTPSKSISEYWDNGSIPWMSVKDFSSAQNGVLEDTTDHITQAGLDNSSSNLVDENAIIICMRMALGKIVKIKRPMAINQDLRAIWVKPFVDNDFFVYFYSTLKVDGHGMTVVGMNKKQLMNYLMPIPPLAEQKRIVKKIDQAFSVLDTIDKLQAQYADNLTALKSKLIDAAIQGKLTKQLPEDGTAEELIDRIKIEKEALISSRKIPKEKALPKINSEDIPFCIPENWKWARVQDVATYMTDYVANGSFATLKANTKTYKERNYALFVRTMDLSVDFKEECSYIDKESYDFLKKSQLFGGELILPNIGASIGKAFIMPNLGMPMSLAPNSIMLKFTEPIINLYFSFIIKSSYGYKLLNKTQGGSATAKFSKTDLRSLIVPIPPLSEIKRIVKKLNEILPLCEKKK